MAVDWSEYGGAGATAASRELPPAPLAYALLLAFSSSTDNFLVGLYVGLSKSAVFRLNVVLALSNAATAAAAASVGKAIGRTVPTAASWLAAGLYAFLAFDEVASWRAGEDGSRLAKSKLSWRLVLPTVLNNVAAGVAGGSVGVGAFVAFQTVLVASFVMLGGGYAFGRLGARVFGVDPRLIAASLFGLMAMMAVT